MAPRGAEVEDLRDELSADCASAPEAELVLDERLVCEVAAQVGDERPALLSRALEIAPIATLDVERRDELAAALGGAEALSADEPVGGGVGTVLDSWATTLDVALLQGDHVAAWSHVLERSEQNLRLGDVLGHALAAAPHRRPLLGSIAVAFGDKGEPPSLDGSEVLGPRE